MITSIHHSLSLFNLLFSDPFASFNQAERQRKYGQLSVFEKVFISGEDPDPTIFYLPDPDTELFRPDPDPIPIFLFLRKIAYIHSK